MDSSDAKRVARATLLAMAERARLNGMSALAWEESVAETREGKIVGEREIYAIGSLVFVKQRRR